MDCRRVLCLSVCLYWLYFSYVTRDNTLLSKRSNGVRLKYRVLIINIRKNPTLYIFGRFFFNNWLQILQHSGSWKGGYSEQLLSWNIFVTVKECLLIPSLCLFPSIKLLVVDFKKCFHIYGTESFLINKVNFFFTNIMIEYHKASVSTRKDVFPSPCFYFIIYTHV